MPYTDKQLNDMLKTQLVSLVKELQPKSEPDTRIVEDKRTNSGDYLSRVIVTTVDGIETGRDIINWTYYPSGAVDTITISRLDKGGKPILNQKTVHSDAIN
jgi:hypothetical protein